MPEPTLISIPTLETPRLVLRTHRAGDFEAYARMWRDPSVYRFIGGQPRTREESWIRFLRHAGMWQMVGFGFWAIEERASGCFIGEAGFHDLKRDTTPSIEGLPEAGWSLLPDRWGRGFATEAVSAVLVWGDRELPGRRQVCIIDAANRASIRVAERCGFTPVGSVQLRSEPVGLYERVGSPTQPPG